MAPLSCPADPYGAACNFEAGRSDKAEDPQTLPPKSGHQFHLLAIWSAPSSSDLASESRESQLSTGTSRCILRQQCTCLNVIISWAICVVAWAEGCSRGPRDAESRFNHVPSADPRHLAHRGTCGAVPWKPGSRIFTPWDTVRHGDSMSSSLGSSGEPPGLSQIWFNWILQSAHDSLLLLGNPAFAGRSPM